MPEIEIDLDFDLNLGENVGTRYIRAKKVETVSAKRVKYSNARKLAKQIKLEDNTRWDVIVPGNFIFGDLIEAFVVENNAKIKEMTISTLSMDDNNIDSLRNLYEWNRLDKLNIVISNFFYAHERHSLMPYMIDELDIDNKFQVAVAAIHTKIVLMETTGGKKIVMSGSANLRSSDNIEQFTIEENKELYDFHKEWHDVLLNKFSIIDKSQPKIEDKSRAHKPQAGHRGKKLWNTLTENEKMKDVE